MLKREEIARIKEMYPKGTPIRLYSMEGEQSVPPGSRGVVDHVDDIGQIHMKWENGSCLALNIEVDRFDIITQQDDISEKKEQEFIDKVNEILDKTDFLLLNMSCNTENTSYAAETLLAMHQAFEEVYGEGYVDEKYGMVMMPAVVKGTESGIKALALVTLDLESSGEHWGTTFLTPGGPLVQGNAELTEEQKRAEAIGLTPDGGIDDDGGAEKIGKRDKECAFFTELFAGEHPKCRGAGDVRQNGRELYHERIALRVLVDTEQAAERLNDVEHVEIAGGIIEEEVPVIHVIKAVIVRIGGPRFKAGDVGLEPVDVVAQNKAQDKPQSEHGAEDGHGGQAEDRSFLYTGAPSVSGAARKPSHSTAARNRAASRICIVMVFVPFSKFIWLRA